MGPSGRARPADEEQGVLTDAAAGRPRTSVRGGAVPTSRAWVPPTRVAAAVLPFPHPMPRSHLTELAAVPRLRAVRSRRPRSV